MYNRISSLMGFAGKQINDDVPFVASGSGAGSAGGVPPLRDILNELQGLSFAVGTGIAAGTGIAISGIGSQDTLAATVVFASGVPTVPTDATITTAGQITFATTNTSGDSVLAVWYKKVPQKLRP